LRLVGSTLTFSALALAHAVARNPARFDAWLYAKGGPRRALHVVLADAIGEVGVAITAAVVLVAWLVSSFRARVRACDRRAALSPLARIAPVVGLVASVGFALLLERAGSPPGAHEAAKTVRASSAQTVLLVARALPSGAIDRGAMPALAALADAGVRYDAAFASDPRPDVSLARLRASLADAQSRADEGGGVLVLALPGVGSKLAPSSRTARPFVDRSYRGRFKYAFDPHSPHTQPLDRRDAQHVRALADAEARAIDDAIAEVVAALAESGRTATTTVIVTAAAGVLLPRGGERTAPASELRDEALRVPLVVVDPKRPGGRRFGEPISLDALPEAVDAIRSERPARTEGAARIVSGVRSGDAFGGAGDAAADAAAAAAYVFASAPVESAPERGACGVVRAGAEGAIDPDVAPGLDAAANAFRARTSRVRMVHDGRFKLVYTPQRVGPRLRVFDTAHDADEAHPLALGVDALADAVSTRLTRALDARLQAEGASLLGGAANPLYAFEPPRAQLDVLWVHADALDDQDGAVAALASRGERIPRAHASGLGPRALEASLFSGSVPDATPPNDAPASPAARTARDLPSTALFRALADAGVAARLFDANGSADAVADDLEGALGSVRAFFAERADGPRVAVLRLRGARGARGAQGARLESVVRFVDERTRRTDVPFAWVVTGQVADAPAPRRTGDDAARDAVSASRLALIVRPPASDAPPSGGSLATALPVVRAIDVAPSVLAWLGVERPATMRGLARFRTPARGRLQEAPPPATLEAAAYAYGQGRLLVRFRDLVYTRAEGRPRGGGGRRDARADLNAPYEGDARSDELLVRFDGESAFGENLARADRALLDEARARLEAARHGVRMPDEAEEPEEAPLVVRLLFAGNGAHRRVAGAVEARVPPGGRRLVFSAEPLGLGPERIRSEHGEEEGQADFAFVTPEDEAVGVLLRVSPRSAALTWSLFVDDAPWPADHVFVGALGLPLPAAANGIARHDLRVRAASDVLPRIDARCEHGVFVVVDAHGGPVRR
jgi:arylsulfatase A-like enzyme